MRDEYNLSKHDRSQMRYQLFYWVPPNSPLLTTYGTKKGYHKTYSHYGDTLEAVEIQIPLSNLAHRPKDNKEHAECCPFSVKE